MYHLGISSAVDSFCSSIVRLLRLGFRLRNLSITLLTLTLHLGHDRGDAAADRSARSTLGRASSGVGVEGGAEIRQFACAVARSLRARHRRLGARHRLQYPHQIACVVLSVVHPYAPHRVVADSRDALAVRVEHVASAADADVEPVIAAERWIVEHALGRGGEELRADRADPRGVRKARAPLSTHRGLDQLLDRRERAVERRVR
jgi:hypothetical protein